MASDPLSDPSEAVTIRKRDGRILRTDGPFAETREWLGGYFLADCGSPEEARELAMICPTAEEGSVELRPILERGL